MAALVFIKKTNFSKLRSYRSTHVVIYNITRGDMPYSLCNIIRRIDFKNFGWTPPPRDATDCFDPIFHQALSFNLLVNCARCLSTYSHVPNFIEIGPGLGRPEVYGKLTVDPCDLWPLCPWPIKKEKPLRSSFVNLHPCTKFHPDRSRASRDMKNGPLTPVTFWGPPAYTHQVWRRSVKGLRRSRGTNRKKNFLK